jgi:hypothetical protein
MLTSRQFGLLLLTTLCALVECGSALAQEVGVADGWPLEELQTVDGRKYRGLIRAEVGGEIEMVEVVRPKNKPMFLVIRPIEAKSVVAQKRLPEDQRRKLRDRVDAFRSRSVIEAGRMENVQLAPAEASGRDVLRYRGPWFTLDSTADDETTRRSIVRVEQIFRAYRQLLPPRVRPQRELRVLLFGSLDEYRQYLGEHKLEITNPAFFAERTNVIVAGSDLTEYSKRLTQAREQHRQVREQLAAIDAELEPRLADLRKRLQSQRVAKDKIDDELNARRAAWKTEYNATLKQLGAYERRNDARFAEVTEQMFRRLYHEGLHAYLENCVYPHAEHDVPIWLNEGLAQIFQSGQLDGDALRIDAPLETALTALQDDLKSEAPLRLDELLLAGRRDFLAGPEADGRAEKLYAHAWGIAYYLTFNEGLLRSGALDEFVSPQGAMAGPLHQFERLTGTPLTDFEPRWRAEMLRLKAR